MIRRIVARLVRRLAPWAGLTVRSAPEPAAQERDVAVAGLRVVVATGMHGSMCRACRRVPLADGHERGCPGPHLLDHLHDRGATRRAHPGHEGAGTPRGGRSVETDHDPAEGSGHGSEAFLARLGEAEFKTLLARFAQCLFQAERASLRVQRSGYGPEEQGDARQQMAYGHDDLR